MLGLDREVTQNSVVETEAVLNLGDRFVTAFDVEKDVVSLDKLLDRVSELTTTPVFDAVDLAALFGDEGLVAFDHSGNLFALIGVHNDAKFVVTHLASLRKKLPRASILDAARTERTRL